MRSGMQMRRAGSLLAYWRGDRLFFRNFAKRVTVSARPVTCEVLDFFRQWRTAEQAVVRFSQYNKASVRFSVAELLRQGLLVVKDSPEAEQDSRISKEWSTWLPDGSFHFSTKDVAFVRDDLSVRQWKAILPKTAPPSIFKNVKGAKRKLPPANFSDSEFIRVLKARRTHRDFSTQEVTLKAISQLLSLVWGVTGYLRSPMFGRAVLKTSPSGGARHPGEVYLMALRVKGLDPGLYHYHPGQHHLRKVSGKATRSKAWLYCARQDYVRDAAALFIMTAIFPRTMWKYHLARAYRVVLLETGHLCQTFCLAATWLGLAPFCTAALKDTLIEQDLKIDGIRESVLYVAGIGLPPRQRRNGGSLR